MNPADFLLRWVSYFQKIRAARVRAAAFRLHHSAAPAGHNGRDDPQVLAKRAAWRTAEALLRLGHVEETVPEFWRPLPPALVQNGDSAFLSGARSEGLRERLSRAAGSEFQVTCQPSLGPEVWTLRGGPDHHAAVARACGLLLFPERGLELLASLPALRDELRRAPVVSLPENLERWHPGVSQGSSRWAPVSGSQTAPGLFRTRRPPRRWFCRRFPAGPVHSLDTRELRQAGAWEQAASCADLRYTPSPASLSVASVGLSFPLLVERGLISSSGRLPTWAKGRWEFSRVELSRAVAVARVLGIPLLVTP